MPVDLEFKTRYAGWFYRITIDKRGYGMEYELEEVERDYIEFRKEMGEY